MMIIARKVVRQRRRAAVRWVTRPPKTGSATLYPELAFGGTFPC